MAGVFLSYDRDDSGKARAIAAALEKAGHSVWWDFHIRGGAQYSKEIEQALKSADAVVVLWSEQSVDSPWVRDEAASGRDSGRLVPVLLDTTEPPLGFRQFQSIDLSRWKGRASPALGRLLAAVDSFAPAEGQEEATPPEKPEARRLRAPVAIALAFVLAAIAALVLWRPWSDRPKVSTVAVTSADQRPDSQALARDLLVQLGTLQSSDSGSLQLAGPESGTKPDFLLEVGSATRRGSIEANVALLDGRNRILMWSKTFQQPAERRPDLRQQIAYSAAQTLRCAGETSEAGKSRLNAQTRRLYLTGCADFAETYGAESGSAMRAFEQVVEASPDFRSGWQKLLLAAQNQASALGRPVDRDKAVLATYLAEAEKRFPDMPEIYLARLIEIPPTDYKRRTALIDRAKELDPDNPYVLVQRAAELAKVGRTDDAIVEAGRAAELEPLSPSIRNAYIATLAYAGRTNKSEQALSDAERLWPGASSVVDAAFRYHLRFGDPRKALALLDASPTSMDPIVDAHRTYLLAKIDPDPANIERALREAKAITTRFGDPAFHIQALGEFGREEEIFALFDRLKLGPESDMNVLFRPALRNFRRDPRFIRIAARLGLLDFWRNSGRWPEFCLEPDLPYDCKKEAARLTA